VQAIWLYKFKGAAIWDVTLHHLLEV
jgi:hypothetical protein